MINAPAQLTLFEDAIESIPDERFTPPASVYIAPKPEYMQPRLPLRYFDNENAAVLEPYLRGEDGTECEHELYNIKLEWGRDDEDTPIVWGVTYSYLRPMEVAIFNDILEEYDSDESDIEEPPVQMKRCAGSCRRMRRVDDEFGGAPDAKRSVCVYCERDAALRKQPKKWRRSHRLRVLDKLSEQKT